MRILQRVLPLISAVSLISAALCYRWLWYHPLAPKILSVTGFPCGGGSCPYNNSRHRVGGKRQSSCGYCCPRGTTCGSDGCCQDIQAQLNSSAQSTVSSNGLAPSDRLFKGDVIRNRADSSTQAKFDETTRERDGALSLVDPPRTQPFAATSGGVYTKTLRPGGDWRSMYEQSSNTIVTAFYRLPTARHSFSEYRKLLERLFSSADSMIIFTSPDLVANLTALRGKPKRTLVVPMTMNESRMAKLNLPTVYWESLPTKGCHYSVYWLWNEKAEFLKKGVDMDPFRSNFFAWMDAGIVRWDAYTDTTLLQRIPPELDSDKMMVLNVTRITNPRKPQLMMGAGIFGGYKDAVYKYHHQFYKAASYASKQTGNVELSSEQHLMYRTCIHNPGLCFTIRPEFSRFGHGPAVRSAMFYPLAFLNMHDFEKMKRGGLVQQVFGDFTAP